MIEKIRSKIIHLSYRFKSRKRKFSNIYKAGGFSGDRYPLSGIGSSIEETQTIRRELPKIIEKLNAHTLLDAPCGDFFWMERVQLDGVKYFGADIVPMIIKRNSDQYANENRSFFVADIVQDDLPLVDVILSRDCFIHLSNKDTVKAIKNFKRSGSRYLLTNTYINLFKNKNLVSGRGWRPINLNLSPFGLPEPLKLINENLFEYDGMQLEKCIGLWDLTCIG